MERIVDRQTPCPFGPLCLQSEVVHVDILRGSSGLQKTSLESLEDRSSVVRSLRDYASTMNGDLLNHVIAESFVKPGKTLPVGEFFIKVLPENGWNLDQPREAGYFYVDGDFGLALGLKRKARRKPIWLACTSFSAYQATTEEIPLIEQLQARGFLEYTPDKLSKEEVNQLLQSFRWEHLLVSLVSGWALSCSLPGIALISSKNFKYPSSVGQERAYIRYDVTARRMGFKQRADGNYLFTFERLTST